MCFVVVLTLFPVALPFDDNLHAAETTDSVVMQALREEMARSFSRLKNAGDAPVYYIAYRVFEREVASVSGDYGSIKEKFDVNISRTLDVELRVGSPKLDNSHKIPVSDNGGKETFGYEAQIPYEDDKMALRNIIWLKTDAAFRLAQKKFAQVKANKDVLVAEDDRSDDYVVEKPQVSYAPKRPMNVDHALWQSQVRESSAVFRDFPFIRTGDVDLTAQRLRRYLVTSTGAAIEDERISYDARLYADTVAEDGMVLWLIDRAEVDDMRRMPDAATLKAMAKRLGESLERLRKSQVAQPYAGPAILQGKAAAVFFHEIFGHRIEGHRQKDESEGRTFTDKVGMPVMPKFISVIDDASAARLGKTTLNGYYRYDDEGVPSQKVVLVDKGVLRRFLMSCSPIRGFKNSNGHGRCREGHAPVARQANLMVVADQKNQVSPQELRAHLIREIKRQKKPYGLIFDDIEGGSTLTRSSDPQIYNLYPLKVIKVYPDGRPDELLRGVDIVGTPLASLELILSASSDVQTFNGVCGAESGWIPVSASSPSLLVKTIEVARQAKPHNKPPLLPDPLHETRQRGVKR
ncbi:MAG: hypothetical protein IT342_24840 [Candidatus Melainabacteria bacterium]|nr:hypothetical protein [Candidatus Melainabacteria bacterium]